MRTVEVLFVILILLSAFVITSQFAVLPTPRQAFGTNLRELSSSTLDSLDTQGILSKTIFSDSMDDWADLQKALSASLPPNIVYNLTVYDIVTGSNGVVTYDLNKSISDAPFTLDSDAASLLVTSPDVTFTQDPQKIGESSGESTTLYILNCNDANGWWITGYTSQTLAVDFYNLLSPYFTTTILVNSTVELDDLLSGKVLTSDPNEAVGNAVVVNTFGEAIPISTTHATDYSLNYTDYCYFLGEQVNEYNWTWVSIVGYPFYYISNLDYFADTQNDYGIYGMNKINQNGTIAFLDGLTGEPPSGLSTPLDTQIGVVHLTPSALESCNYYGIYPNPSQTSARALNSTVLVGQYGLDPTELFVRSPAYPNDIPAATYRNDDGGALTAIGLTRIPDIRVTALALLMYYQPTVYRSEFGASGTSRLVTLQLSQQGGT
ncbi:MAG: hypothetical protein NWF03_00830 [Candidatus Bathyarchaeota archaeon]|nr:hypothetical protein [Candidatus Bathyarchaeota archaeon]